ncbi:MULTISPECIES: heliorhodopsin HeR [Cryobacterium]|uniref:Yip1 domain-containing protein n=1 Tax=Cryobacterium breve TaxID=1259258 RepID=A0ABY2JAP7_9MICO|nr:MULTISPECIES: heliorhodopsin HeR [Cryobacterium]TFC91186.1 hypothetical protein E3T20_14260 [Cryobacterium sp. TmT3-12]TFD01119.1 hypothetical protein E3O65_02155 [Cryobacterium breve]
MMTAPGYTVTDAQFTRLRAMNLIAGIILFAQAVLISAAALAEKTPVLLPVTARFPGGPVGSAVIPQTAHLADVNLGVAVVILLTLSAVLRFAQLLPAVAGRYRSGLDAARNTTRWVEYSQVSAITVFLIAQLNGVTEVGTLVALYAITASATLFLALQESEPRGAGSLRPFVFGTMVGIVPWGIIAFYQIGAGTLGDVPELFVRTVTLSLLAVATLVWTNAWLGRKARRGWAHPHRVEMAQIILVTFGTTLLAGQVLTGVLL